jgi:hypothetical protein
LGVLGDVGNDLGVVQFAADLTAHDPHVDLASPAQGERAGGIAGSGCVTEGTVAAASTASRSRLAVAHGGGHHRHRRGRRRG